MMLLISDIKFMNWMIAFAIVIPVFIFFISIPSFISMYKLGFKAYIEQLVLLRTMFKKVSTGYKVKVNQVYTYSGSGYNGSKTSTRVETNHFFPIVINKDNLLVLNKKEGTFNTLHIQYCKHINDNWENNVVQIKTSSCLFTQFLNDRFQKKVDNLMKESIQLDAVENLNELLNSQIASIKREYKLNAILND
jgi:hypothetical protein